ncbi:MAG: hypothetical protein J7647_10630 [Cyanobacteria bacterium SBLK]|nr:hypothetical protein [Cyanobacteria bacterium SBLK]
MIVIRKSKNESSETALAKDLRSIPFSQRIYADSVVVSYKTERIDVYFSCGYIPKFDLKHCLLSRQFDRLSYKTLWTDEHEKLARIFLDVSKDIPVKVYNFPHFQEYLDLYLSAYLKNACWIAANDFHKKRRKIFQRIYDPSDYYVMAWEASRNKEIIFRNFHFESKHRVETHAIAKLIAKIRDETYKENPRFKQSKYKEYGLLRHIAKENNVEPALKSIGLTEREIERIILVWRCFKKIYRPQSKDGKRLPQPTLEDCVNIAQLYNCQCDRLVCDRTNIAPEEVIPCLEKCIKAIEEWINVSEIYPDRNFVLGESSREWEKIEQDYFSRNVNSSFDNLEESVTTILDRAFARLSADEKGMLTVIEFGLQVTQTELGSYLGIHQATIARRRDRVLQKLYLGFRELWNIENPDLAIPKTHESLVLLKKSLKEELTDLCFFRIDSFFEDKRKSLKRKEKEILKFCYKRNKQNVVSSSDFLLNIKECDRVAEMFKRKVLECLGNDFGISPESLELLLPKIDTLFQRWLYSLTDLN